MKTIVRRLLEKAWVHDDNAERNYLREKGRLNIAWAWCWTSWIFGMAADFNSPTDTERWCVALMLGPFSIEVFWSRPVVWRGPGGIPGLRSIYDEAINEWQRAHDAWVRETHWGPRP